MRHSLKFVLLLLLSVLAVSCEPNIKPAFGPGVVHEVSAEGGKFVFEFEAGNRWGVVNDNSWIYVSPGAGLPGKGSIKVEVDENRTLEKRSGYVYVIDGRNTLMFGFSQDKYDIISTDNNSYYVPEKGSFTIKVSSSVPFSLETYTEWIVLPSETHYGVSTEGREIEIGLRANTGEQEREGSIALVTESGDRVIVYVIQAGHVDIDWSRAFYKRSLAYRFTGDWCGYCPNLEYDIASYRKDVPGRLNVICFYDTNSSDKLVFPNSLKYETRYNASDKPTLVMDERAYLSGVASPGYYNAIKALVEESRKSYGAATAITLSSDIVDGVLEVHPSVFVKEAGDYHIHVVLLEDGIVVPQHNYTDLYKGDIIADFVHDGVARCCLTPVLTGEAFSARAESVNVFNYTRELPYNVINSRNLSVAVYVTRQVSGGDRDVAKVVYYKNRPEIVDNSVSAKIGQSVSLKYE